MKVSRRDFLKTGLVLVVAGMVAPGSLLASVATVPVLMYHDISNHYSDEYTISSASFAAEMEWLYANGYRAVACSDLEKPAEPGQKHVVITFDDGYASFIDFAFPLLLQYSFKATINIIGQKAGSYINMHGNRPMLSWDEYKHLWSSGLVELGCHSYNMHMRGGVTVFTEDEFARDLQEFRRTIRSAIGHDSNILAWPYGIYTQRHIAIAQQAGFRYLLTSNEGLYHKINNLSEIPRININDRLDLVSFQQYLGVTI